jgi:predicted enzyme related to lactoylglutathione lyase
MTRLLVNIDVGDLEAAVRFYVEAFSLRVGRRFGSGAVELTGADAPIYLLAKPQGSPAFPGTASKRAYARHWTPVHLDFLTDDIEQALARAEAAGAVRESEITDRAWGRIVLMADPFGNGFCLIQFQGRGYDELVG